MKKLNVILYHDKQDSKQVGQLVESGHKIFFEYDPAFLTDPIGLSPFKLPTEPGLHEHIDRHFGPLFGLFDDSLPDGWGLLLMDRFLRKKGVNPANVSVLDRLAFLGHATMGALVYEPPILDDEKSGGDFDLLTLADHARKILSGRVDTVLPQLMRAGGSPGGARPKVLVGVDGDRMMSGEGDLPESFEHWIVKFNARRDGIDAGTVEYAYAVMAGKAGIDMPETRLFKTDAGDRFFGIKRFDRENNRRFHVHTLGNLLHVDFRIPSMDYEGFLKVIRLLTGRHDDLIRGFRQMVFNVMANNRDDHVKNFAFMLDHDQEWTLTPAYDLTYSQGPGGEHSMTLAGEGSAPGIDEIMQLGKGAGLSPAEIRRCVDQVRAAVDTWVECSEAVGVSEERIKVIQRAIELNRVWF